MNERICVVTGANAGIGKETARSLAARGATVVMACRDLDKAERARVDIAPDNPHVHVMRLDLGSRVSIEAFVREFESRFEALHVLVNNAGLISWKPQKTADGHEVTFGTNHLGPFVLTLRLLPLLEASAPARIINVASDAHFRGRLDFDDLQLAKRYRGFRAYSNSKLCNVLFTRVLADRLAGTRVTANALHPGVIATNLFGVPGFVRLLMRPFTVTAVEGAATSVYLASAPDVEGVTGKYFDLCKEAPISAQASSREDAERLWAASLALAGFSADPTQVATSPAR